MTRYAQEEIIGICVAMSSLDLPPYVLLWIIDRLPNYDRLSHQKFAIRFDLANCSFAVAWMRKPVDDGLEKYVA